MEIGVQTVLINFIDADTMHTIEKDFMLYGYPASAPSEIYVIKNGCASIQTKIPNFLWLIDENQVKSYGYDPYSFPEDLVAEQKYIDYGNASLMVDYPSVITIRLRKLEEVTE